MVGIEGNPVGIILGSDSDLPVMKDAAQVLEKFGVGCEMNIASAHRAPEKVLQYARTAEERGLQVIIAGAGKAAHLPGVIAASTVLPVIGVPLRSSFGDGVDSLYSIVQMPSGIPVATVAVDGAKNAAILAVQILSLRYPELRKKIRAFKAGLAEEVAQKDAALNELGYREYLAKHLTGK
ncbi:MAG: 5-(carboxyamino)imidazole ribonucleotide mutase [bacterium]|jgi:5-(carboxyamino)imidazole ribonucleotide mutase